MATSSSISFRASQGVQRQAGPRRGSGGGRGGGRGGRGGGRPQTDCRPQQRNNDWQVAFKNAFPAAHGRVAIIGGGLSGLVCAEQLARRGLRSVVFDTGEHGVGGRLATRSAHDASLHDAPADQPLVLDHAAQYFTAADPAFQELVQAWEHAGAVKRWRGPVGTLANGKLEPLPEGGEAPPAKYIASGGMRQLAQHLAARAAAAVPEGGGPGAVAGLVEIRRPQWVSSLRYDEVLGGWKLTGRGRDQGCFDAVVIAHNGKCANRLTAGIGAPQVHSQLRRLKLSANWVLMVAFARPLDVPFEGAFIKGSEVLSWAGNNTAKLSGSGGSGSSMECWTLISTQPFGRANKVPQENVPPETAALVTQEMLAAFERSLGLAPRSLPPVVHTAVQLWGAALPQNTPNVPCIWDPASRVGVCGDWLLGSSMQAAALSGMAMAERIALMRGLAPAEAADLAIGLTTQFKAVEGEDIGQFPASAPQPKQQPQQPRARRQQQQLRPQQQQQQQQQQPISLNKPRRPGQQQQHDAPAVAATS